MRITRRGLLIGTLAGGGLIVGWALQTPRDRLPLPAGKNERAFNAWIKVATDGTVSVAIPQLEMGQGIMTLLAQIVAVELGADWRRIAIEPAPISAAYANSVLAARWASLWRPLIPGTGRDPEGMVARRFARTHRFTATADGTALAAYEAPAREAAAAVRAVLAMAAAERWGVGWEECEVRAGAIHHGKRTLGFGALAMAAAGLEPPDPPVLRPEPAAERPAAFPAEAPPAFPRLDLPAKANGSAIFAGDVRLPDLVYAAIRHGPIGTPKMTRFDRNAAAGLPGVLGVVRNARWLAAIGTTWWAAERALAAMTPQFTVRDAASSDRIEAALDTALRKGDAVRLAEVGDPDTTFAAMGTVNIRYDIAPAHHAGLETATATARLEGGRLELWLASQAPEEARQAAAQVAGLPASAVVVYPVLAGGAFDARLEPQIAREVTAIAMAVERPVQLVWSRWQEMLAVPTRPPVAAVLSARTVADGGVAGWKARIAVPAAARQFGRRLFDGDTPWSAIAATAEVDDPLALDGAIPPYAIPNVAVDHVPVRIDLPAGRLRGNAHGYTAFFTESFVDELAAKARREPLSFRIEMLGADVRLAQCLQQAARLAEWGGGGDHSGQGIACHRIGDGCIAVIATARRDEAGVRVDKLTAVADIGRIVNVDIARQQIEGGLVFGIGLALGCAVPYERGLPVSGGLGAMNLPRLAECPAIDVSFVESTARPADPGELGVAAAAPAIANALFSATGLRFRRLPLLSDGL